MFMSVPYCRIYGHSVESMRACLIGVLYLFCAKANIGLTLHGLTSHGLTPRRHTPHGETPHGLTLPSLFVSVDAPHYRQADKELCEVTKEK